MITPIQYEHTAIEVLDGIPFEMLTHTDATFVKAELIEKIAQAIAAAVAAERHAREDAESDAKLARVLQSATQAESNDAIRKAVHAEREACEKIARLEGTVSGNNIAAAIRARGEGGRE